MSSRQTHYPTNRQFLSVVGNVLFWGGLIPMVGFKLVLSAFEAVPPGFSFLLASLWATLLPIAVFFGAFVLICASTEIVTSPAGIELHQMGFCTMSNWSNLTGIAPLRADKDSPLAIYFYEPAPQFLKLFPGRPTMTVPAIPLANFRVDAESELGRALRRYRPDLFFG